MNYSAEFDIYGKFKERRMTYFNELNVDLNDDEYFPPDIYERTIKNPNSDLAIPCLPCNDSLDKYASSLISEIFTALEE